ncbi:Crp/Fnr family transcriptional regulator [Streptomyces sp. NPDC054796]
MGDALWHEVFGGPRLRFPKGRTLLRQGEKGDCLYCLVSGVVSVIQFTPDGREVPLAFRGTGDLVGDMSIVSGRPRNAYVVTATVCEAVHVTASRFLELLARRDLVLGLLRAAHDRQHESDLRLGGGVRVTSLESQLAKFLLALAEKSQTSQVKGWTQQHMAARFGVSHRTLCEALMSLRARGAVATGYRCIEIKDYDTLRIIADS